jgi:hypothetical protein
MSFKLHPGAAVALRRLRMNEYEVAEAIRDGELASPQTFENMLLVDMRISGTGVSYRPKLNEWVYRRPENYLTPDYLKRAAGMPIIYEHPEKSVLDSESFGQRVIGTMQLPYIKGNDVWGVARIYDRAAAKEIVEGELSTSPSVVFRDPQVNYEIELQDGSTMLVEGSPSYVDHLAVCAKGVWDKGGSPSGIRVDAVDPRWLAMADGIDRLDRRLNRLLMTRAVGRLERRIATMEARGGRS